METLRAFPFEDLGFAQLDHHRALRKGFPEVIFCESKTVEQVVVIADRIVSHGADLLATRVTPAQGEALCAAIPQARYNPTARTVALR
ncbi:MAG TPA: 1-(5-phosphoribosyl)-5-amino-4-imidazole-carboxylate carboxylase, partial [Candidatus Latescibacteria bacterium]|nr:1-(5-phosphoribosyl)-5-amino-4-imidazole-carboxylate carboxylase [Candidatus Latescibacterota bacterium]